MKKGLTLTLMTVAIAMISVQAHALAPLISDIPNVVVGGSLSASNPNMFVYNDAFDLNALASDDGLSSDQLMWTYEIPGTPKYRINGVMPWNTATDNLPTSPTAALAAKIVNRNVGIITGTTKESNPDNKANTVTIRNINLWPLGQAAATLPPAGFYDQQAVEFYCSDGMSYSSQTVFFFTEVGGANRLSPKATPGWTNLKDDVFPANMTAWTQGDVFGTITFTDRWVDGSGVTTVTTGGTGVCLTVPGPGDNMGSLASPMGYFSLAANQVYRIRARMNSTQSSPGHTPLWDFVIENYDGATGYNLYGYDYVNFDNEGGANSVITTTSGTWYTMYWAPSAVDTAQWNDSVKGLFVPAYAANKDPRIRFRVLDLAAVSATQAQNKSGTICMQELVIDSIPISKVKVVQNIINLTEIYKNDPTSLLVTPLSPNKTDVQVLGVLANGALIGTTISFWNDATQFSNPQYMRLTPSGIGTASDGSKIEIVEISPATDNRMTWGDWTTYGDNYPIPWKSNKLYRVQVTVSAPDAVSALHPYDVIFMSMDSPTNENNAESMLSSNKAIGSPKNAAPQTYTFFHNTGNETRSATAALHNLRWRVRFANNPTLGFPSGTDANNIGKVDVRTLKVDEITFTP